MELALEVNTVEEINNWRDVIEATDAIRAMISQDN